MSNLCFLFASQAEQAADKIIQKYFHANDEYDILFLSSSSKDKILKKDVDLDLSVLEKYKLVCPIGAEALKYSSGYTGITKYNGVHIEKKYIPIMHPNMVIFKPQLEPEIEKAFSKISPILNDENLDVEIEKDYEFIQTQEAFEARKAELEAAEVLVNDIESTSVSPYTGTIIGIAISIKEHYGLFISSDIVRKNLEWFHNLFKTRKILFHNAKFDIHYQEVEFGFEFPDWEDTMLLHYTLEEAVGTHGLKPLAMRFTDLGDYDKELNDYKKTFCRQNKILIADFNYGMLPIEILSTYACKDGDATFQLYSKFKPLVDKSKQFTNLYNRILKPATVALMSLERNGGPIDKENLLRVYDEYQIDIEECIEEINMHPDVQRFERAFGKSFNPNSTVQLRNLFSDVCNVKLTKKTTTGAYSVDKEVLAEINHPIAEAILDLREKSKMAGTYLSNILEGTDKDGRLRANFIIHGTTSGRLSSSGNLNYQNIPRGNKDIKKIFAARPGYKIVQCDLGTAEVYYAAVLSGDTFLQQAFIDKLDFHSYVAKQMFKLPCEVDEVKTLFSDERQYAKAITFGIMYQAGPAKIAETVNKDAKPGGEITPAQAKQFINKYFNEARALKKFIDESNRQIENNGYIYSFFGRKRRLPESRSSNPGVAKHAIRSGVNFLVQSVASDINLLGVIDLVQWIEDNGYQKDIIPFTVVHDSIVSEVREDLIEEYIENTRKLVQTDRGLSIAGCPIKVDFEVGPSWGELQELKG